MRRFDLRSLRFDASGETWRRLPVEVAPFVFGGIEYELVGDVVDLLLTAGRVGGSVTLVAEFEANVVGPCQRCLAEAVVPVRVRAVEYARHGESEVDDEDAVGYLSANVLDVERWTRDLIAEALPVKLLCGRDCRGLCPECGVDLNADPGHQHGAT